MPPSHSILSKYNRRRNRPRLCCLHIQRCESFAQACGCFFFFFGAYVYVHISRYPSGIKPRWALSRTVMKCARDDATAAHSEFKILIKQSSFHIRGEILKKGEIFSYLSRPCIRLQLPHRLRSLPVITFTVGDFIGMTILNFLDPFLSRDFRLFSSPPFRSQAVTSYPLVQKLPTAGGKRRRGVERRSVKHGRSPASSNPLAKEREKNDEREQVTRRFPSAGRTQHGSVPIVAPVRSN